MSNRGDLIAGWCPGALRPMESGDGFIVRIRPRLGKLSLVQLETLGRAAQCYGDGSLHLSNRANVQMRGVKTDERAALLEVLTGAGLIDSDPRVEAVRNVMLAPALGDGACPHLAAGLAAKLEELLAKNEALHGLPGKFGAAVQTGSAIDAGSISDVTFLVQKERIAMLLEGDLNRAVSFVSRTAAVDGFLRVALAFLELRLHHPDIRRMRDLIGRLGADAISKAAGLSPTSHGLSSSMSPAPVGDMGVAFGMAFAFGEITQPVIQDLTAAMRHEGIAEAAVSQHRALVLPAEEQNKAGLQQLATKIGAITDPADIRLRVFGCPGAPACSRGTVPARHDAREVLEELKSISFPIGTVHISGCEKRCAYPYRTDIAAIGADGCYTVTSPRATRNAVAPLELAAAIAELARTV